MELTDIQNHYYTGIKWYLITFPFLDQSEDLLP